MTEDKKEMTAVAAILGIQEMFYFSYTKLKLISQISSTVIPQLT